MKYIVNLKRIFDEKDYLNLLQPTDENITLIWKTLRNIWDDIGCDVPFERFYLSRLDFTCDIHLNSEKLVQEYIRLLGKSILLPNTKKFSVEGIHHKGELSKEIKEELQQNTCKYKITNCEDIQYYNKLYELKKENLPIPKDTFTENNILRIELQIHKTKRITEYLQQFKLQNENIDTQFSFFIKNADFFLLNRLELLYPYGKYYTKSYIETFIQNDNMIKSKNKKRISQFVSDCNKQNTLGRCLEIDKEKNNLLKRKKSLKYLTTNNINPVCINSTLKGFTELPDVFELIHSKKL